MSDSTCSETMSSDFILARNQRSVQVCLRLYLRMCTRRWDLLPRAGILKRRATRTCSARAYVLQSETPSPRLNQVLDPNNCFTWIRQPVLAGFERAGILSGLSLLHVLAMIRRTDPLLLLRSRIRVQSSASERYHAITRTTFVLRQ